MMDGSKKTLPNSCLACTNEFTLRPDERMTERTCPFCGSLVWPASKAVREPMSEIGGFQGLKPVEWDAPGVVFEANRDGERFLITLLDCGDSAYTNFKLFRDSEELHYGAIENEPHPNFLEFHPVQWVGDVAIVAIEYLDGKSLLQWIEEVAPINVADAVSITLACARFIRHVDGTANAREIGLKSIHIKQNGEIKITAFGGPLWHQFELSPESVYLRSRQNPEERNKLQKRIGMGNYFAPETMQSGIYVQTSDHERNLESIYCLGCLLFELVTDRPVPMVSIGKESVRSLELIPVHEIQPESPPELSAIVSRMMAFDPDRRYENLENTIHDLEALGLDSPRVTFVNQNGSSDSPVPGATARENPAEVWFGRSEGCDFRNVRWGMTKNEVREAEPKSPDYELPVCMVFKTSFQGLALILHYNFTGDDAKAFCVGVSIQLDPATHQGFLDRDSDRHSTDDFTASYRKIEEEIKQLSRDQPIEFVLDRQTEMFNELMSNQSPPPTADDIERESRERLMARPLDREAANDTYEKFKELIRRDFGEPEVADEPVDLDPETLSLLDETSDPNIPNDFSDCKYSFWRTESTLIEVMLDPQPFGDRIVLASLLSAKHAHLVLNHPKHHSD